MAPVLIFSPALKGLLSTVAPWLIGSAAVGAVTGFHAERHSRLESRVARLVAERQERAGAAPPEPAQEEGVASGQAPPAGAFATREGADGSSGTADADTASSAKASVLRRVMESNILLRRQPRA